jgi:hypothetical protein
VGALAADRDAAAAQQLERIDAEHQADGADHQQRGDAHAAGPPSWIGMRMPPPPNPPDERRSSTFWLSDLRRRIACQILVVARLLPPRRHLAHQRHPRQGPV